MSITTKHYKLEAFGWGDIYSSSVDKRRMTIIDSQIELISNLVGNGVIFGWEISDGGLGSILVAPGMGIINKRVLSSFGSFEVPLSNNTIHYLYFERNGSSDGGVSGNSNIEYAVAVDTIAPSSPSGEQQEAGVQSYLGTLEEYGDDLLLYVRDRLNKKSYDDVLEIIPYREVIFSWSMNTEFDFNYYKIQKLTGSDIEDIFVTDFNFFIDTGLEQNSSYIYRVIAVDFSGNESFPTEITVSTSEDVRIPSPPSYVQAFSGRDSVEIIWGNSYSDNISYYKVVLEVIDYQYNKTGEIFSKNVSSNNDDFSSAIFSGINGETLYMVTVFSVPNSGLTYMSDGVSDIILLSDNDVNDVDYLSASFVASSFDNVGMEANIIWGYDDSSSSLSPVKNFVISFIENGKRFSENIEVAAIAGNQTSVPDGEDSSLSYYSYNIKYIPYTVDDRIKYETIKEYTSYVITVKTENYNGVFSNGFMKMVGRTLILNPVDPISNFSIVKNNDNSILASWDNPDNSYFYYNLLTITMFDVSTGDVVGTVYQNSLNIGKSKSYSIPSSYFNPNYRYRFSIVSYNVVGSEGGSYVEDKQFSQVDIVLPLFPTDIQLSSGDGEIGLTWLKNREEILSIEYYKIYRSNFNVYLRNSDFSIVATVTSDVTSFIDYTVENDVTYSYFVSAVDIYGNESIDIFESSYVSPNMVYGNAVSNKFFSAPYNLSLSYSSNNPDVTVSWEGDGGDFDGYEILRSDENEYSFVTIGYTSVSETSYVDEDALKSNGESYFYAIRKYKNDVKILSSGYFEEDINKTLIGIVSTSNGVANVDIDISLVVNLTNYEDPLKIRTEEKINIHHHNKTVRKDKRIELRTDSSIFDWETNDYKTYTSLEDIEGSQNYVLNVSGEINEAYFNVGGVVDVVRLKDAQSGKSPVLYDIKYTENKLFFSEFLYSPDGLILCPYLSAPSITLYMMDISEVDNYIEEDKIKSISATQINSGQINVIQMPLINHDGRKNDKLIPLKVPLFTFDQFNYSIADSYEDDDRNKMGNCISFYDVISINTSDIMASTSQGIMLSTNFGSSWSELKSFPFPIHKIYKSENKDFYAISNYGVYKNDGSGFMTWDKMNGLSNIKCIRDITEDSENNIYISSDLGVFKLNNGLVPYIRDSWEKMPIFGANSSEAYAIIYDPYYNEGSVYGRILVSGELGLFESTDEGRSWSYISDLEPDVKVRKFLINDYCVFALSDDSLYRAKHGESSFEKVSSLVSTKSKDIVMFEGVLYIVTDKGTFSSLSEDIYNQDITFVYSFSFSNTNNKNSIICVKNELDHLFICTEKDIYILDSNLKKWKQFGQNNVIVPTFYIGDEVQNIGFYFSNSDLGHNVSFDERIDEITSVSVCNKYDTYISQYGGWVDNKFNAKFFVYKNNIAFGESPDIIEVDVNQFADIVYPSYDDTNSHKEMADIYKQMLDEKIALLSENYQDYSFVSDLYNTFELFLSQIYEDSKYIFDENGNKIDFNLPNIFTDIIKKVESVSSLGVNEEVEEPVYYEINDRDGSSYRAYANLVNGTFYFDVPFSKYDDIIVSVYDISFSGAGEFSHTELEDEMEYVYSGASSNLSQIQQSNIVKLNIFTDKMWPGEQSDISPSVSLKTFIPSGDDWYDTLNSTINYNLEDNNDSISLSLHYPSCVEFSSGYNKIFVGGHNGIISIEKESLDIAEVVFEEGFNGYVRDIFINNDNIYILTNTNLYISDMSSPSDDLSWSKVVRDGLPNDLYSIGYIGGNILIGAIDGIYLKISNYSGWEKVVDSSSPVSIMCSSNILLSVIDKKIYSTVNGLNFSDTGLGEDIDINNIVKYGYSTTYISSNQGLFSDNGTFNSLTPSLYSFNLQDLFVENLDIYINDVATNSINEVVIALSDGKYGFIKDGILRIKENTSLDTIHKILFVEDDIWVFGGDSFKSPLLKYPVHLSSGVPF